MPRQVKSLRAIEPVREDLRCRRRQNSNLPSRRPECDRGNRVLRHQWQAL